MYKVKNLLKNQISSECIWFSEIAPPKTEVSAAHKCISNAGFCVVPILQRIQHKTCKTFISYSLSILEEQCHNHHSSMLYNDMQYGDACYIWKY